MAKGLRGAGGLPRLGLLTMALSAGRPVLVRQVAI